ncbi:DNA repair protein rhp26 [Coemansia sp. RSA 1933]|nr:DNA repair protein rhp26 [Coemansia sp. RSA 1933]
MSNDASPAGKDGLEELRGLSELGVRVMDQSVLERSVHAIANRDIVEKELEVEQKRLVRVEAALMKKREQIEKSSETASKASAASVRYQNAMDRIERLEEEVDELEGEMDEIMTRIEKLESQISTDDGQTADEQPITLAADTVIQGRRPSNTVASVNQGVGPSSSLSSGNLADMILPKRKAAKAAETRRYALDQDDESSDESPAGRRQSTRQVNARKRVRSMYESEDADFVDDNNEHATTAGDEAADSGSASDDESGLSNLVSGDRDAQLPDDDGNELAYQDRLFNWCATRWSARQSEIGGEQLDQSPVNQDPTLDCVTIDGKRVPREKLADEPFLPDPGTADHVVKSLDRNKLSLRVPRQVWERLLGYQRACMSWMYTLHQQNAGGILGDEMGLGKTVQVAAFLASMYHSRLLDKPSIVICPATLLRQWVSEFHAWCPALRVVILHGTGYGMRIAAGEDLVDSRQERDLSTNLSNGSNSETMLPGISEYPGFGAEGNSTLAYDSADDYEYNAYGLRVRRKRRPRGYIDWKKNMQKRQKKSQSKKRNKASRESLLRVEKLVDHIHRQGHVVVVTYSGLQIYKDVLLRRKWGYAVLDEGHTIRNPDADVTIACKRLDTRHRILVTGTPIQNNLTELWSLFDFIFPGRLGTLPVFNNQFAIPITVGGYASANSLQVRAAYRCACILRDLIDPYLLRRLKADVAQDLPQKSEQVLFCRLTPMQRMAYKAFVQSSDMERIMQGKLQMLFGVDVARKICDHPDLLLLSTLPSAAGTHRASSTIKEVIAHAIERQGLSSRINSDNSVAVENTGPVDSEDETVDIVGDSSIADPGDLPPDYGSYEKSGKLTIVRELLTMWKPQGHKVLVFSQTRQMLDIIESLVARMPDTNYRRMDGATPVQKRAALIDEYNNNPDIYVFLLTTKVGGLGINLTGANRVILYSPDWNPSSDMQARERAWRLGQKRDVAIYRLMTAGTIEEKIYNRQIYKQFLTNKILADPKQKRFFHSQSLRDLFSLSGLGDGEDVYPGVFNQAVEPGKAKSRFGASSSTGINSRLGHQTPETDTPQHVTDTGRNFADAQLFPDSVFDDEGATTRSGSSSNNNNRGQIESIGGVVRLEEYRPTNNSSDASDSEPDNGSNMQRSGRPEGEIEGSANAQAGQNGEDRVLQSLFKMSGVHSAFQHDAIVNSKDSEAQAIDREADRIANDARNALKQSQCSRRQININVPTWTGAAGNAGIPQSGRSSGSGSDPFFVPPPPNAILSNEIPMEARTLGMRAVGTPRNKPSQADRLGAEHDGAVVYHPSIAFRQTSRPLSSELPSSSAVPSLSMKSRGQTGVLLKQANSGGYTTVGARDVGFKGGRPPMGVRTGSAEPASSSGGSSGGLSSSNILAGLRARAGGISSTVGINSGDKRAAKMNVFTNNIGENPHPLPPQQQQQQQKTRRYRTQQLDSTSTTRKKPEVSARSHGTSLTRPQRKLVPHGPPGARSQRGNSLNYNDIDVLRCIRQALVVNGGELASRALVEKVQADFAGIELPRVRQLAQQVADLETRQPKGKVSHTGIGRIVQKVWKLRPE